MKKTALTSLIVLIAIKSVSACEHPNYVDFIAENVFYGKLYFYSTVFLIIANFFLFFIRKQNDYLVLVIIIISTIIATLLTVVGTIALGADCGSGLRALLGLDLIYFFVLTVFHVGWWLMKRNRWFSKAKFP